MRARDVEARPAKVGRDQWPTGLLNGDSVSARVHVKSTRYYMIDDRNIGVDNKGDTKVNALVAPGRDMGPQALTHSH